MSSEGQLRQVITVNGEERPLPGEGEIVSLLVDFGIEPDQRGLAVAVNGEVVPRAEWDSVRLSDGDRVELVRPVQGG